MSDRETGTVKNFDNHDGYGYIKTDQGMEIYVHYSAIICDYGNCTLSEGDKVEFILVRGSKGPQAQDVVVCN